MTDEHHDHKTKEEAMECALSTLQEYWRDHANSAFEVLNKQSNPELITPEMNAEMVAASLLGASMEFAHRAGYKDPIEWLQLQVDSNRAMRESVMKSREEEARNASNN